MKDHHKFLTDALRSALFDHYSRPNEVLIYFPLEEALSSLVIVAGEIASAVPKEHRREAFALMADVLKAAEKSGADNVSIGMALAKLKGVNLN